MPTEQLDTVRKAMLDALASCGDDAPTALERKLLFAKDIGELWYARPELMNAVASGVGEARARDTLVGITRLFDGMRPGA